MTKLPEGTGQSFGTLLRSVRKQRGLTLNKAAALADMCSMRLSRIERNTSAAPTRYEIARLAYVLAEADKKPERFFITFNQLLASAGIMEPEHRCLWFIHDHLSGPLEPEKGQSSHLVETDQIKFLANYAFKVLSKPPFYVDEVDHRKFLEEYDGNTSATV